MTHDLTRIPLPFVNRLGELSQGILGADLIADLARLESLLTAAKDHIWVMTPRAMGHVTRISAVKVAEGVKIRSIMNEENRKVKAILPSSKNVERKLIQEVPLIVIISEEEASVSFPGASLDGQADFASSFFWKRSKFYWIGQ